MNSYFVDTSYWLALEVAKDQNHQVAQQHWQQVRLTRPHLVTTSYILDEIATYLNNRGYHQKAVQIGNMLLNSPAVTLIQVDEMLFRESWLYFQQHHDKRYSLTDCISFIAMRQLDIQVALTFDHHFNQAGFQIRP